MIKVYHVTTTMGETYGTAATGKRDAMLNVQARLTNEGSTDTPASAQDVGRAGKTWEYGLVLHY